MHPSTGGSWEAMSLSTKFVKLSRGGINQLEHHCEEALSKRGSMYHQRYHHHFAMLCVVKPMLLFS